MWRTLRQVFGPVFCKRSGNPTNLRLGQVQLNESKDEVHHHGIKARQLDHHISPLEISLQESNNLLCSLLFHANRKRQKKTAKKISLIGGGQEQEHHHCGSALDELKLWFTGVLALSSILSCRNGFIYAHVQDHIDVKRATPALAVLPVVQQSNVNPSTKVPAAESSSTEDSLSHAVSSFAAASSQCTAACQNKLGVNYAAQKYYYKAFALFHQASKQQHSLALFNLGLCFENGKGTEQDLVKAAECYKKACALKHPGALFNLALFYMEGIGGLPKDHNKGLELLEVAAQGGLGKAQSYLGIYYANKSSHYCNYSKAISYLEQAAIRKDKEAEYHLGICYEHGLGVEQNMAMAGQMYKAAAKHGNISAQFNVGVFYEHGLADFPVNYKEALRYYRMVAEKGDQDAQHNYSVLSKQLSDEKNQTLNKQLSDQQNISTSSAGCDMLWTIFQQMTVMNKSFTENSSSPDESKLANHGSGNPQVVTI